MADPTSSSFSTSSLGSFLTWDEWELGYRLGMRPWIFVGLLSACAAAYLFVFLVYPFGQGSFSRWYLLEFPVRLTSCLSSSRTQHPHRPFHMLGVLGVFGGALFSAMRKPRHLLAYSGDYRRGLHNYGYKFGQEKRPTISSLHMVLRSSDFPISSFNNSRSLHFFLAHSQLWESGLPPSASSLWRSTSTDSTSINPLLKVKVMW